MAQELNHPPSIRATSASADNQVTSDPVLLRLHTALKELDDAIYETRRALDVALGRPPQSTPQKTLPFRELGRLKEHLIAATDGPASSARRSLSDIALAAADEDNDDSDAT